MAAKNLIHSFEKGLIIKPKEEGEPADEARFKEEILSPKPGFTKELVHTYESLAKTKPAAAAEADTPKQTPKKVLIVFGHWEKKSFDGALLEAAQSTLEGLGHTVLVSDLYEMGFNPVLSEKDIEDGVRDKEFFDYKKETGLAWERGTLATELVAEQWKFSEADLVIFQSPMVWGSLPAMMKGYFDRVLTNKAIYSHDMMFDTGKFKDKMALLSLTTPAAQSMFSDKGICGDIEAFLWPIMNLTLRFVGFNCLPASVMYGAESPGTPQEARDAMLAQYRERLTNIWSENPVEFLSLEEFSPSLGYALSDETVAKLTSENEGMGPNVGQNAGRPHKHVLAYRYPELVYEVAKPEPEPEPAQAESAHIEAQHATSAAEEEKVNGTAEEQTSSESKHEPKPENEATTTGTEHVAETSQKTETAEEPSEKIEEIKKAVAETAETSETQQETPTIVVNGVKE